MQAGEVVRRFVAWLLGWPREADMTGGHAGMPVRSPAEARAARQRSRVRLARIMAVALSLSGFVGILAVLDGAFDRDDARVLVASITFAVFSATAAAGAALRRERPGWGGAVGVATIALSVLAWSLLVSALWSLDVDEARNAGVAALLALAGSHASIVVRGARPSDGVTIRALGVASILAASFDSISLALVISRNLRVTDTQAFVRTGGIVLIAMIVTTALPPLLRAASRKPAAISAKAAGPPPPPPPRPARLSPAATWALVLAAVAVAYSLGQSTGPQKSWAAGVRQQPTLVPPQPSQAAYQPTPPPAPAPPIVLGEPPAHLEAGTSRALSDYIDPEQLFSCATGPLRMETGGPGGRVQLHRSVGPAQLQHSDERSLCVLSRSPALPKRQDTGGIYPVLTVRFHHKRRVSPPENYEVQLGAVDGGPQYMLTHGWVGSSHQSAQLGNVGVARGHVSLIVEDILIPHWVLDPHQSSWTARFH